MAQINEVDIPRWARYWVKPLTPSQVLPRYSDTAVSELQLRIQTPVVSGFQLRIRDAGVYTDTLQTAACIRIVCDFLADCMVRSRVTGTRVSKYHCSTSRVLEI